MGADKSELKALIADGFASEFLDSKQKTHRSVGLYRGAAEGLQKAEQVINTITQEVRNELVEKGPQFDTTNPMEIGKYVVACMMKAVSKIHELSENATLSSIRAEGELRAYDVMIERLCAAARQERSKAQAVRQAAAVAAGNGDLSGYTAEGPASKFAPRPFGMHPGPPMSEERLAQVAQGGATAGPGNGQAADGDQAKDKPKAKPRAKPAASKSQRRRKAVQKKEPDAGNT